MIADPSPSRSITDRILSSLLASPSRAPLAAQASEPVHAYPRLPGDATNHQVGYAPGGNDHVVGGIRVTFLGGDNDRALFNCGPGMQGRAAGDPVFVGVDDGQPVIAYFPGGAGGLPGAGQRAYCPRAAWLNTMTWAGHPQG